MEEKPGWNDQVLKWCLETAQEKNLREEDYWGGFVIDEMKIQVCIEKKNLSAIILNRYFGSLTQL